MGPTISICNCANFVFLFTPFLVRRKPLAPTCNVCLIRNDLTTIWCEVTSSIRTKDVPEDPDEMNDLASLSGKPAKSSELDTSVDNLPKSSESDSPPTVESKELLLCLRPIRDGDKKVDAKYRFNPWGKGGETIMISESSNTARSSEETSLLSSNSGVREASRPPKKRKIIDSMEAPMKRSKGKSKMGGASADVDTEQSVVESLMLMNKTP